MRQIIEKLEEEKLGDLLKEGDRFLNPDELDGNCGYCGEELEEPAIEITGTMERVDLICHLIVEGRYTKDEAEEIALKLLGKD